MYLKSLTLRGFKSFASATTLRFEPGITCAVGPNGSGKSNIVDALCWVMGEQGAKSLRGGKMEDVVFAGTSSRPPLGRAEVTLTIDNSDGALPIDYAEVTLSRLLFRSGQSEYAINGDHCRLLDIQELLSDSGMGREMHVVVGQGQLDDVLHAGPEARRALIEEAAGVLKHRKRKEKALRKLEAMQANLTRLVDLTAELGRRLKPLGRQAEIARRAAIIQAELRDARLRLLADDYVTLREALGREEVGEALVAQRRAATAAALDEAKQREAALEAAAAQDAPRLTRARDTWFALSALAERLRGVAALAAERHHHLSAGEEPARTGRDPAELAAEAEQTRAQETELSARLDADRACLAASVRERAAADAALAEAERRLSAASMEAAHRAERAARLREQAEALRSHADAAAEEVGRLSVAAAQAQAGAARAQAEHAELEQHVTAAAGNHTELDAAHEDAIAAAAEAAQRVKELRADEHQASRERAALHARAEALQLSLRAGTDAAGTVLADPVSFRGVLGPVAALLSVDDGAQAAIAAALGTAADAVAVAGLDAAAELIAELRTRGAGKVGALIATGVPAPPAPGSAAPGSAAPGSAMPGSAASGAARAGTGEAGGSGAAVSPVGGGAWGRPAAPSALVPLTPHAHRDRDTLPSAVRYAVDLVRAPAELAGAVAQLLSGVVVAADLRAARELVRDRPGLRVVTRDGDLLGAHWAYGGSAHGPSQIEVRAAAEETVAKLAEADERCAAAARLLAVAAQDEELAQRAVAESAGVLREADAAAAEVSGRLGRLGGAARAAADEAERLASAIESAERSREADLAKLAELDRRLDDVEAEAQLAEQGSDAAGSDQREILSARREAARNAEMEARLAVRTVEERVRAIAGRADALAAAAAKERAAIEQARRRREIRAKQAVIAGAVARGATYATASVEAHVTAAQAERAAAEAAGSARAAELKAVRERLRQLGAEHDQLVGAAHTAEIARAEQRMRLEQIEGRAVEEFGVHAAALVAEYGPDVPVPPPSDAPEGAAPSAYDRTAQERRAGVAERQLARLGKVNPLALEEFAALEERHAFLSSQVEDLKKTRRDLLTVIREVDERVQQVFAAAYEDTAREFEQIFARLFPGGEGRLLLTEPDDMLTSGVEVEARPPGKKVKRLSLLSGGERSLTAIAYLVAIFKARPSPFYVLDEVEAALDDVNLQRLLGIFEELRESSQLIIITHQKRTMEVADALYGITMRGDGVSAVVSQRLREPASA
ncbi:MAG TPA: AAA family ATPase [Streptosporangiaceae bacterium]|nr:AAA family ATPase [Streptosporangiaceae bacterium]